MTVPLSIQSPHGRLSVEFIWKNDRYTHRVFDAAGNALLSVDGTPDQPWPPSPPIQQLSCESIEGQKVILGVGAAGSAHWSISVVPAETERGDAIKFELACRCRSTPVRLTSTYHAQADGLPISAGRATVMETAERGQWRLLPEMQREHATQQWAYLIG